MGGSAIKASGIHHGMVWSAIYILDEVTFPLEIYGTDGS